MAPIDRVTSKGQLVPLFFSEENVAGSQTNAQLDTMGVGDSTVHALNAVDQWYAPFDGEVVAVSYAFSAAVTAGSATVGASFDGTEDADTTVTITGGASVQFGYKRIPRGNAIFDAGTQIGCELTTSTGFSGTAADLVVTVWTMLYLEGI